MGKVDPVNIPITADTKKAQTAFKELELGAKNLGTSLGGVNQLFGKFAQMAAGTAILGGVVKTLKDSATAAMEEESAVAKLTTVIQNNTDATDDQADAADKWLEKMQLQVGVSDDELRPAFQNLVAATKDVTKAQDLMSVAVDIAAGRGLSLETISVALAKAQNGNVAGLQRLGIATKDASGATLSFDQIMKNAAATYGGTAQAAADTTAGKIDRMKLAFGELKETLGTTLIPVISKVIDFIAKIAGYFQNLPEPVQKIIMVVGLLSAGLAGVGLVIGPLISSIGAIIPVMGALLGPIGLVAAAIAAIIAIVVLCIKYHEEIKAALIAAWEAIKDALSAAWNWIKSTAETVWNAIKQFFKDWWPIILGIMTGGVGLVVGLVIKNWDAIKAKTAEIWNAIKSALSTVWTSIKDAFGKLWDGMKALWETASDWIKGIPGKIKDFFVGAGKWLWDIGKEILEGLWNGLKEKWDKVAGWFKGLGSKIKNLKGPIEKDRIMLYDEGKAIIDGLARGMQSAWPGVERTLSGMNTRLSGGVNIVGSSAPQSGGMARPGASQTHNVFYVSGNSGFEIGREIASILAGQGVA